MCVRGRSRGQFGEVGERIARRLGEHVVVRRWRIHRWSRQTVVSQWRMPVSGIYRPATADPGAVSDFVAASWRRSRGAGVAADGGEVPFIGDVDISSRLVRCSQPIIDRLIDATEDIPLSIALSDNKARVLTRVDTTRTIGLLLDNISLAPGFDYAEGHIGTNGVGTVLEAGRSAQIVGPEHFHERFQPYSCSGAPIHDPMTGHIEGVLDLTCLTEHSTPMLHSIVRSAANEIEQSLLHDRSLQQQALFEAFLRVDSHSKSAVFAIGGRVMMANALAQSTFDPARAANDRASRSISDGMQESPREAKSSFPVKDWSTCGARE